MFLYEPDSAFFLYGNMPQWMYSQMKNVNRIISQEYFIKI